MAIHLVGETIDAKRAHQRAQNGELIPSFVASTSITMATPRRLS